MARSVVGMSPPMKALREAALRFPGTQEGVACAGTTLEKRTIRAKDKAFLFLGASDAVLKLRDSYAEAERLAAKDPARYAPGGHGWVRVTVPGDGSTPRDVLERWAGESYRLLAPKSLLAPAAPSAQGARSTAKKKKS